MSDPVDYVPFETTTAPQPAAANADAAELERLYEVPVELAVEIGRTHMTIRETLALGPGSIVTLNRLAGEPVDLLVNGKPIARGEVVVIDEEFGLRVTEVVTSPHEGDGSQGAAPSPGRPVAGVTGETHIPGLPGTALPPAPVV
jgi:flagellar motor switch protein FliN/FliY